MSNLVEFGQFLWTGLSSTKLTQEEEDFLKKSPPGGVILFSRNYESPQQLFELTSNLQDIATSNGLKLPFLIGIDMEGGRVARLKDPFTIWPPMKNLGSTDSPTLAFDFGQAIGTELLAVGVNFNFAPCVDVLLNEQNEVIGDRAFSNDVDIVGKVASGVIRGLKKSGIVSCVKHFPGHGYAQADSHFELPIDDRALNEIKEISAFRKALRAKPEFIMPGHLMFPKIDPNFPVTLSEKWIKDILLDEIRVRSFLITDDLDMKALEKFSPEEVILKTYELGFDQILYCKDFEKAQFAIEALNQKAKLDNIRLDKIVEFKNNHHLAPPKSLDLEIIGSNDHKDLALQFA